MNSKVRDVVLKIHETPHKAVLAVTGGGSEVIGELLRHGSGSNTILDAQVPYNQAAFDDFVKGKPDKYCSPGAARDLAMAAYNRAVKLAGNNENIIGIGCTCSLMKDGERAGREHHAYIAVQTKDSTENYNLNGVLKKTNDFESVDRNKQETKVSHYIILALAKACGLDSEFTMKSLDISIYEKSNYSITVGRKEFVRVISGETRVECFDKTGLSKPDSEKSRIIFPGSFRPFHYGHAKIAAKIHELTGKTVDLEINVRNVDKAAINYTDLQDRFMLCLAQTEKELWMGDIYLTSLTTFAAKSAYFENCEFIVGWDTLVRINDPKYVDFEWALKQLHENNARLHVFHRIINGISTVEDKTQIHPRLLELCTIYGPDVLEPMDISSSQIRKAANATN